MCGNLRGRQLGLDPPECRRYGPARSMSEKDFARLWAAAGKAKAGLSLWHEENGIMGFKAWGNLGAAAVLGLSLVGCASTPQQPPRPPVNSPFNAAQSGTPTPNTAFPQ